MLAAFLISLKRSRKRRWRTLTMLKELGIHAEVFDATEGASLTPREIAEVYDDETNHRLFKRALTPAEIGCYISHRRLWAEIGRRGLRSALVLEDDAIADERLASFLEKLGTSAPSQAILKLDGLREMRAADVRLGGVGFVCERVIAPRTTGYVIGSTAARRLAKRNRFFRPVDIDLKHYWEHRVPILSAVQPLVRECGEVSTIEKSRDCAKGSPISRMAANLRYQAHFRVALLTSTLPDATHLALRKDLQ